MSDSSSAAADNGPGSSPGNTAVAAPPKKQPVRPKRKRLPPHKLLLHNDDVNTMEDVVLAIIQLTHLDTQQAIVSMLEAHETGVSMLLTTNRERGELYVEQFASKRITTTLERDC